MQTHELINKPPSARKLDSVNGVWSVQFLAGCMQVGEFWAEEKHYTHAVYPAWNAQRGQGRVIEKKEKSKDGQMSRNGSSLGYPMWENVSKYHFDIARSLVSWAWCSAVCLSANAPTRTSQESQVN